MSDSANKFDLLGAEDVVKQTALVGLPNLFAVGKHHQASQNFSVIFSKFLRK